MVWLTLALGILCAGLGGECFVRGAVKLGVRLGIPTAIVAATLAAFATSSPEASVAVNASLDGNPEIALGNAIGANVLNIALTMGIALCFGALAMPASVERRDWPVALGAPVLTGLLAVDGSLSRLDGVVLLAVFASWIVLTIRDARAHRAEADPDRNVAPWWRIMLFSIAGLFLLVLAGDLIVDAAIQIGAMFGWNTFVIGATLVSFGTTLPELATTLISRLKGHSDIGVGSVVGSNIFNGLFIVGLASVIHPIRVDHRVAYVGFGFGLLALLWMRPKGGIMPRSRSALLLGTYVIYLIVILFQGSGA